MPVAILEASCCIFSSSSFSNLAQLSQTTFPYSRIGLSNAVYIISSDLRSSLLIYRFSHCVDLCPCFVFDVLDLVMPEPVVGKVLAKVFVGVNFFDLLVLY